MRTRTPSVLLRKVLDDLRVTCAYEEQALFEKPGCTAMIRGQATCSFRASCIPGVGGELRTWELGVPLCIEVVVTGLDRISSSTK